MDDNSDDSSRERYSDGSANLDSGNISGTSTTPEMFGHNRIRTRPPMNHSHMHQVNNITQTPNRRDQCRFLLPHHDHDQRQYPHTDKRYNRKNY